MGVSVSVSVPLWFAKQEPVSQPEFEPVPVSEPIALSVEVSERITVAEQVKVMGQLEPVAVP